MKKTLSRMTIAFATIAAALLFTVGVQAQSTYDPYFNTFTGVDGVGNEADFFRIREPNGTKVDTIEACSGDVTLWMYVHNDSPEQNNDNPATPGAFDGVGVARNTRVKVNIPNQTTNSHVITGQISADNARATVTDTASITCAGKKVKIEYVSTDPVYTTAPGGYSLNGSIVSANGAQLGYDGGVLPGCWQYRAWITLHVRIVPEQPQVQNLSCTNAVLSYVDRSKRIVNVTVNGNATNGASINGYRIDFGDGTVVDQQTATHTYTRDGNFTITTRVLGTLNGQPADITSSDCMAAVSFGPGPTPPTPPINPTPSVLPNTGPGGAIAAIFASTSIAGTIGYRFWAARRQDR